MITDDILHSMLEKYRQENRIPASIEEIKEYAEQWLPLTSMNQIIGVIGLDIIPENDAHPLIAVIKTIYVDTPYRGNFTSVVIPVLESLRQSGVKYIHVVANRKISKWLTRYGDSHPFLFGHYEPVEQLLNTIKERKNGLSIRRRVEEQIQTN